MTTDHERLHILKLHKTWADRYTVVWQIVVILLFGAVYAASEYIGAEPGERNGALTVLATMLVIGLIWQAVGLGIARVHMLLNGIDLGRPLGASDATEDRAGQNSSMTRGGEH